ncbi:methyltransferase domain-containing protein [Saccharopolyspora sp. CA-218241]|uniref:methyltransferase domain-containing protein n=1 Tax=Saccharopolyspora sp. CA-218241 TaxID=3240027 RepID=UPI003D96B646
MDQRSLVMHQVMLADGPRMRAYDQALERAVEPGDVVVDVGAGTLVLGMLALRHGAEHVYAVEADPEMAAVAERIIRANDLGDRITLLQGDARAVRLPRKADVIVSEMMGNLGPEEQMAEVVGAVARRNLAPGGRIVPQRLVTRFAAIEFDAEGWGVWHDDLLGFHLDVVAESVRPEAQLHFFQRDPVLLGEPVVLVDGELGERPDEVPSVVRLPIGRSGRVQAVMGYFEADFGAGVSLANFPSYPGCNWAVWIWPVRSTDVDEGDEIRVVVHRPPRTRGVRDVTGWRLDCAIGRGNV